jgi:hypothetical protein
MYYIIQESEALKTAMDTWCSIEPFSGYWAILFFLSARNPQGRQRLEGLAKKYAKVLVSIVCCGAVSFERVDDGASSDSL